MQAKIGNSIHIKLRPIDARKTMRTSETAAPSFRQYDPTDYSYNPDVLEPSM